MLFLAVPALAAPAEYFSWQEAGRGGVVCARSDKQRGTLGDCERPGPKDLAELYCDPKFAKGSGRAGSSAWRDACKKYEASNRHAVVLGRAAKYFAWQRGARGGIECKEVPKGFGTPGKCVYPGPKNVKELICHDEFFRYSGEKVDQDVYCHRRPWRPPARAAEEDDDGGDGGPAARADGDGDGKAVPLNPVEERGESGVSSEFQ